MGKSKVKVKSVSEIDPTTNGNGEPLIINFEHGQVNPAALDKAGRNMTSSVFESAVHKSGANQNSTGSNKRKRVAIIQTPGMTYVGSSDNSLNADTSKGDGLRTLIGIRRKNKMYIYEANSIVVSPYLENYPHLKPKDSNQAKTPDEKRTAAIDLIKAFGSKKKKLTYERLEKQQINKEHLNESMAAATKSAVMPNEDDMPDRKDTTILELIPPCNRETKDESQVYLLRDILTDEDLDQMTEMAEQWINCSQAQIKKWREDKTFSDYFFEMWRRLSGKKKDPQTIAKARMVLYTELLICLLKLKFSEVRKKVPNLPTEFPSWLVQKALDQFTGMNANNLRCRSDSHKDKTCCYIMVLVLLTNNYLFDVQLMSTSLQIHIKKLQTLAKAVGITMKQNPSTKEHTGVLKLPLPQQIERRGRVRQMRK